MPTDALEYLNLFSWDILVFAGITIAVFAYAYTFGKDYVVPGMFTLYIAAFLMLFVPQLDPVVAMIETDPWLAHVIVFVAVYLIIFFVMKTNGFFEPYVVPTGFEIGTFALAFCGLLFVIIGSFFPVEMIEELSPWTNLLFYNELARSIWAAAPVATLLLVRGET